MRELELLEPGEEQVREWEKDFRDSVEEGNWLGRPEISLELQLLNVSRNPQADSVNRMEPKLSELHVLGCFKDTEAGAVNSYMSYEGFPRKLRQISRKFREGLWEVPAFLDELYDAAPEDVDVEFYMEEAEIESLPYLGVAYELEEFLEDSEDFAFRGVTVSGESEASDPLESYNNLVDDLSINIHFSYGGDEQAVEYYNEFKSRNGNSEDYSGVPGRIFIGSADRPIAHIPLSSKVGLKSSEVESRMKEGLESTVASDAYFRRASD